jgi:hypothetical protein
MSPAIWIRRLCDVPPASTSVVQIGEVLSVCRRVSLGRRSVGLEPYIECVFENDDLVELDAAGTLAAAEANEHTLITAETRRLQIAPHWADLHPGDAVPESQLPGSERPVRLGGDGTPTVADFAPAELGCVLRISDGSACRLIGDALDLRHRLRLIWAAALTGQVPPYQARHIASTTRHLTAEQAAYVDTQLAPSLGALSWGRLQTLLDAKIIEADPVGAEQQAAAAAQQRFVRLGRNSEHGLKLIIARATAGDAIWFKATIDRIADILTRRGDLDSVDIRRSKAIGILAQPALALQLLCQHQHDEWDGPTEPTEDEPGRDEEEPDQAEHHHVDQNQTDQAEQRHAEQQAGPAADDDQTAPADTVDDQRPRFGPEGNTHRSPQILPPPFHPDRARPRAIIYVHLSEEALTAGRGLAQPPHRPGSHHPLPQPRQRWTARPNQDRQSRTPHPLPPQSQNPRRLAGSTTRTRHLALAITPRLDLPRQRHRHPRPRRHRVRTDDLARRQSAARAAS